MPSEQALQLLRTLDTINATANKIIIRLDRQILQLFKNNSFCADYPVSTSRYGVGCEQDSLRTPLGIHQIAEKIGVGCKSGEIFQHRKATGEIAEVNTTSRHGVEDVITSRILWLEGKEPGLNSGTGIDSYHRYIYIHGTNEEGLIGQPASKGCVRMKNSDVIELFDQVNVGDLVLILKN